MRVTVFFGLDYLLTGWCAVAVHRERFGPWLKWMPRALLLVGACGRGALLADPQGADGAEAVRIWDLLLAGKFTGLVIIALSFVAFGLIVYYFLTIRKGLLLPEDLLLRVHEALRHGRLREASERCRHDRSLIGRILTAGLREGGESRERIRQAMEDAGGDEVLRLQRRISYLSLIGTIAPMLGLYGTVIGMIRSFNTIAQKAGVPKPSELAEGISQALVTTWLGLFVAIPAMFFYGILLNRVAGLALEAGETAEELMAPLLRRRTAETRSDEADRPAGPEKRP